MKIKTLQISDWKVYRDDEQNKLCILNETNGNILCLDEYLITNLTRKRPPPIIN